MKLWRRLVISSLQAASIAAFLVLWQLIWLFNVIPRIFIPSPIQVFTNFVGVIRQPNVISNLEFGIEVTFLAFGAVMAVGIVLGLVIGSFRSWREGTTPYLVTFAALPRSMFLVVFLLLFGFGLYYQFWFAFMSGLIPILINTIYGTKNVDLKLVKVARSMGASRVQVIRKIVFPSLIPSILTGARISFAVTYGAVVLAEELVGANGIGYLASTYAELFRPIELYSIIVFASLFGIAMYLFLLLVERRFTRWSIRAT